MLNTFDGKRQSKTALMILLLFIGVVLFYTLYPFVVSFLGALIFYVLFRPFMTFLCEKKKWSKGLAAAFLSFISFVVIVLPIFLSFYVLV